LPADFNVWSVPNTTWDEMTLTYRNAPALGGFLAGLPAHSCCAYVAVDLPNAISGDGLLSVALTTTSSASASYPSRQGLANPPLLEIVVTN
jgi:hypothetical protein